VDIEDAGDEFDDPSSLANWAVMQGDLPTDEESTYDVGRTQAGALTVLAGQMTWVDSRRGFFLSRDIQGDFAVTVRVLASGRTGPSPTVDWSLTGLLMRAPTVEGGRENWVGYTVGYMGRLITERKTTRGSRSILRLEEVQPGWIELRAARLGELIVLLRRQEGYDWVLEGAYSRPDLPEVLQVGINAGTGAGPADLVCTVDWIRFARPDVPADLVARTVDALHLPRREDGNGVSPRDLELVRDDLMPYLVG
jgi:hypothetical protein